MISRHNKLSILLLVVLASTVAANGQTLRGNIRPANGETTIPRSVAVTLSGSGLYRNTFAIGGTFTFHNVPPGSYSLTVVAPGHKPSSISLDTETRQGFRPVAVVMGPTIEEKNIPPPGDAVVDLQTLRVPDDAREEFEEGVRAMREDQPVEAEDHFRRATQLYPDFYQAHIYVGVLCTRTERLKEAQEAFTRAVEIQSENALAQTNLGLVLLFRDLPGEAIDHLEAASRLDPSNARVFGYLGEAYFLTNQWDKARTSFKKSQTLDPQLFNVSFRLGEISAWQGDLESAFVYFKRAVKQNPPEEWASAAEANIEKLEPRVR